MKLLYCILWLIHFTKSFISTISIIKQEENDALCNEKKRWKTLAHPCIGDENLPSSWLCGLNYKDEKDAFIVMTRKLKSQDKSGNFNINNIYPRIHV